MRRLRLALGANTTEHSGLPKMISQELINTVSLVSGAITIVGTAIQAFRHFRGRISIGTDQPKELQKPRAASEKRLIQARVLESAWKNRGLSALLSFMQIVAVVALLSSVLSLIYSPEPNYLYSAIVVFAALSYLFASANAFNASRRA